MRASRGMREYALGLKDESAALDSVAPYFFSGR
jgi:hypothetical protein